MKNKTTNVIFILFSLTASAQVGINTPDPKSTLDVNGNTIIREVPDTTTLSGYKILTLNQNSSEVSQIDPNLLFPTTPAGPGTESTVFSERKISGISLSSTPLFSTWKKVNFVLGDRTVGSPVLFSNSDNAYITPTSGIYAIGFYFRYGSGIQPSLLADDLKVGILRNTNGNFSTLETRNFNGANLGAIALTISEININSVYSLNADDKIYFALTNTGTLEQSSLDVSSSSFYIYKISD